MIKRVRILQVIGSLNIGGAENFAMNFARYLDKIKFQCDYLVFGDKVGDYENEAINLGSKVIHIPLPKCDYKKYYENLKRVIRDGEYDVVHSHMLLNNGLVMKASFDVKVKKRISHSHSTTSGHKENIIYKLYKSIMKKMIRKYTTDLVACGLDAGNFLYGEKIFQNRGIVINNGINIERYRYNVETREKILRQLGLESKFVIGHIGRFAKVKNHDFLLDVFYEVNKLDPDSNLIIVGDGELRGAIESKIMSLGLKNKVILTGMLSDVSGILQAMDIFIFPSLYEGLPLTLIEAQASGMQCIVSTNVTSQIRITDLITFMPLNKSAEEWARKVLDIAKYLRFDKSEELIEKGYDVFTNIKVLEKLYQNID